ncbi:12835_t:CDS:2, partial [Entrophospora sp. SA101]
MRLLKRFVYIFYITFFLLILSTTIIFTNAFSISWVYEDLLAHPQYKVVVLENQLIPNSRIENHVIEKVQADSNNVQEMIQIDQSSSSGESSEKSKPTSIIMRTSTGQPYVCSIPYIDNQTTIEENKNNSDDNNKNNGQILVFFTHHRPHFIKQDLNFFKIATEEENFKVEKIFQEKMNPMFKNDYGDEE